MTEVQATADGALQPTRDPRVTLPDLLQVLLDKGVYLNLDAIITVADIPLVGINLRATIAGIETMLEYGMMRSWDERTRAWVQRSVARQVPLAEDEALVAKMAGGHYQDGDFAAVWRPGTLYLTSQRLIAYRRDPAEILWQTALDQITAIDVRTERAIGGEDRERLHITTSQGQGLLSAAAPQRLRELIEARTGARPHHSGAAPAGRAGPLRQGQVWYREDRAGGHLWRGGRATLEKHTGLRWHGALDARPAVRLGPGELTDARIVPGRAPTGGGHILALTTSGGSTYLAAEDATGWLQALQELIGTATGQHPVAASAGGSS